MKQRSILFGLGLLVAGALILPNLAGWLVRDFMHQTMRMACDFDQASVDPLKGNLTIKNLSIAKNDSNAAQGRQKFNKVETVWARYSLPQLMYRRFDAYLIAMNGVQIAECDGSSSELPKFALQEKVRSDKSSRNFESLPSTSQQISNALRQSKLQGMLEAEKKGVEKELKESLEELARLKQSLNSLASNPLNHSNRLRSESEAKRIQSAVEQTDRISKNLQNKLNRVESETGNVVSAARKTTLVDWMSWCDQRKDSVQSINADEVVTSVLSEYARHLIEPMHAPLKTTHSISKWSTLEQHSAQKQGNQSSELPYGDFLSSGSNASLFDYRIIKLRGKTLVGSDPLAMAGTITKAARSKDMNGYARPISLDMRYGGQPPLGAASSGMTSAKTPTLPISAKATYDPTSQKHHIFVQYAASESITFGGLSVDPFDPNIHASIVSSKPRVELSWSIDEDRWECGFDLFASEVSIFLNFANGSSPEQVWKKTLLRESPQTHFSPPTLLGKPNESKPYPHFPDSMSASKAAVRSSEKSPSDVAVFHIRFNGKLADGCFDNSNETVQSKFAQEIGEAFKGFFKRQTEADLIAEKQIWTRESESLISALQTYQKSANQEIRQNLDTVAVEIRKEQERLAQALSDPSDIRFSRKTSDEPSKNLRR